MEGQPELVNNDHLRSSLESLEGWLYHVDNSGPIVDLNRTSGSEGYSSFGRELELNTNVLFADELRNAIKNVEAQLSHLPNQEEAIQSRVNKALFKARLYLSVHDENSEESVRRLAIKSNRPLSKESNVLLEKVSRMKPSERKLGAIFDQICEYESL